jgi:hypothetical protein
MRLSLLASIVLCAGILTGLRTADAAPVTIDFESFDLGGVEYLDVAEVLNFPDVGGSGVAVMIVGNTDLRIYDLFKFGGDPKAVGQGLIDWPWSGGSNPFGTAFFFDNAVASCSLKVGDFGADDDSPLKIRAFDENDHEIAADSLNWPASAGPPFPVIGVTAAGIRKVIFSSGGIYAGSIFIDYVVFDKDAVPAQPPTWGRIKVMYK